MRSKGRSHTCSHALKIEDEELDGRKEETKSRKAFLREQIDRKKTAIEAALVQKEQKEDSFNDELAFKLAAIEKLKKKQKKMQFIYQQRRRKLLELHERVLMRVEDARSRFMDGQRKLVGEKQKVSRRVGNMSRANCFWGR